MGEPCVITRVLNMEERTEPTMADVEDGGREP